MSDVQALGIVRGMAYIHSRNAIHSDCKSVGSNCCISASNLRDECWRPMFWYHLTDTLFWRTLEYQRWIQLVPDTRHILLEEARDGKRLSFSTFRKISPRFHSIPRWRMSGHLVWLPMWVEGEIQVHSAVFVDYLFRNFWHTNFLFIISNISANSYFISHVGAYQRNRSCPMTLSSKKLSVSFGWCAADVGKKTPLRDLQCLYLKRR